MAETEFTLEDIEDFEAEEITLTVDEMPAVECRSTVDPDSEPAKFSGPVSELATDNASEPAVFTTSTPANEPIDTPASTPETTGNKASMDHFISETIVVGVPGSDFLPYEYKTESENKDAVTENTNAASSTDAPAAANDTQADDEAETIKRPGLFRRLLSGIGSIFRRS